MTAPPRRQHRPKKDQPARVVRIVRHGENATYIWDRKPNRQDCKAALLADPPYRPRVGHCWPGFDEPADNPMPTPTIIPTLAPNRTRRPVPDPAPCPADDAGQDERARCKEGV